MKNKQISLALAIAAVLSVGCSSEAESSSSAAANASSSSAPEAAAAPAAEMAKAADQAGATADDSMTSAAGEPEDAAESMAHDMHTMADKADAAAEDALLLADASDAADGDPCNVTIKVRDSIAFSTTELSVPSTCSEVSVTLEHIGQMPKTAMGHNWVLLPADDLQEIAMAAMTATAESSYIPEGEDRIVAYTKIIGGGESDTVTFSLSDLEEGTEYAYVCTFPGHWSVMRGKFTVTG